MYISGSKEGFREEKKKKRIQGVSKLESYGKDVL